MKPTPDQEQAGTGGWWEGPGEEGRAGGAKTNSRGTGVCTWGATVKKGKRPQAPVPATRVHARCTPTTRGGAREHPAQSHARRGD